MKKYNIQNYVRYKEDLKRSMPGDKIAFSYYTRDELIIKFMPLVENLARKFSTSDQASGVLSINDLIQEGNKGLILAVDKLTWETLDNSDDIEKTLKSFLSKRIKGAIRRAIDINRGNIRIPEHKLTEIRKSPKDAKIVLMFFNSIDLMNTYLLSLMRQFLNYKQYETLRMSYGLDCDKASAKEIAIHLEMTVPTATVIVSQIKKEAIDCLVANVDADQVIDYL